MNIDRAEKSLFVQIGALQPFGGFAAGRNDIWHVGDAERPPWPEFAVQEQNSADLRVAEKVFRVLRGKQSVRAFQSTKAFRVGSCASIDPEDRSLMKEYGKNVVPRKTRMIDVASLKPHRQAELSPTAGQRRRVTVHRHAWECLLISAARQADMLALSREIEAMFPRGPAPDHPTCLEFALHDRVESCGRYKNATQVGRYDRRVDLTKPGAVQAPNLAAPGIMEHDFVAERDDEPIPKEVYRMGLKA